MGKHVDETRPLDIATHGARGAWERPYVLEWDWGFASSKMNTRDHLRRIRPVRVSGWVRVYTDEIGD